jgi:hypothetical protein
MDRCCEVCASVSPAAGSGRTRRKLRRFLIESRVVALCEHHARLVDDAGAGTLAELRRLFPESAGNRSLLPRRAPLDRRVFPPRPEGRRRNMGRRTSDDD